MKKIRTLIIVAITAFLISGCATTTGSGLILPPDIHIQSPDPTMDDISIKYLGIWQGQWTTARALPVDSTLIIEKITPQKKVFGYYTTEWGKGEYAHADGTISMDGIITLICRSKEIVVIYNKESDNISVEFKGYGNSFKSIFNRYSPTPKK